VETANVIDHAHRRVSGGRQRRRLETEEERARLTVERDCGRRLCETAEQVAARRAADQEYQRHRRSDTSRANTKRRRQRLAAVCYEAALVC